MFEKQYMIDARDRYVDKDIFVDVPTRQLPLNKWTAVFADNKLMNHLIEMFFTWDNIVERAIYRPIFEEDVVAGDPASDTHQDSPFCNRFFVNALLAASCVGPAVYSFASFCTPIVLTISALHPKPRNFQSGW